MAGKAKSYYVTVFEIIDGKHRTLLNRQFFDAASANAFKKEKETEFPKPKYSVMREYY